MTDWTKDQCLAILVVGGWSQVCYAPTIESVPAGCLHEHVSTRPLCAPHRDALMEGHMDCANCALGALTSEPHRCVLVPVRDQSDVQVPS